MGVAKKKPGTEKVLVGTRLLWLRLHAFLVLVGSRIILGKGISRLCISMHNNKVYCLLLTMSLPVLLEHPKSLGGFTMFCRLLEVWYSFFPPRADQKPATVRRKHHILKSFFSSTVLKYFYPVTLFSLLGSLPSLTSLRLPPR